MYLIDGNNVIGARVGWHRDKSAARKQLLVELARFVQRKRARVAVVFDGAPEINIEDGSSYRSVKVYFSGLHSDADSRILRFVEAERNRQALTVVTSDGQLTQRVRACGVQVIRAGVFRRILEKTLSESDDGAPQIQAGELSEWMRYFGVDETDDELE
ncbi:MAG: NYN domain-containing protein [Blastocatellia bacterium]